MLQNDSWTMKDVPGQEVCHCVTQVLRDDRPSKKPLN